MNSTNLSDPIPAASTRRRVSAAHSSPNEVARNVARPVANGALRRARPGSESERVLAARAFEALFERERCLADRGTRRFTLLVLKRRAGPHGSAALAQFAQQVCARLRSTDIVGQTAVDRVEILLTDTEAAGAQVVARWVEPIGVTLGLELGQTLYVYPSAEDQSGHADLNLEPGLRSPVQDLWPLLGVPTPLWKRALDIFVSTFALLLLLPLFALIALAIRLDSPGPAIFRQQRAGRGGRAFVFFKFRSMSADAETRRAALAEANEQAGPIFKIRADPRITRVGRLLRRWSLDELPQLWNVLLGDISLVGPRSPTLDEVQKYERWQRRRLYVTGGITCTWQVSGRSQIPFQEWMRLDMRYVAARTLWLDLRLLVLTLPAIVTGRGAC